MLLNEPRNCIQLNPPEAAGTLQGHGFQPEFCYHVLAPDVDVGSLSPIQGHEEEAIRTDSKDRRHFIAILSRQAEISTICRSALSWTPVGLTRISLDQRKNPAGQPTMTSTPLDNPPCGVRADRS